MKTAHLFALSGVWLLLAGASQAQDFTPKAKGQFIVTTRITTVAPDARGDIKTGAGVDSGLDVDVGDLTVPTLGFTYFLTDHVAVEGILGTSKHKVKAEGAGTDVVVHETWVLPPVVTVQYHFNPKGRVSPYVGAGVNAMIFYEGKDRNGFKLDIDNGFGTALQAGVDIAIRDKWALNFDAKKVFFETDANINTGALRSGVTLDPWVVSVGAAYRF